MYPRPLAQILEKSKKSVLLLGPRQTGKSTLIGSTKPDLAINLARESEFLAFASRPSELEERLAAAEPKTVFIDEVQRLPSLLNTVQAILDEQPGRFKFYLTGSSARKLRRGRANLLPGRIHAYDLHGLSCTELGFKMNSTQALSTGTLPGVYAETSDTARKKILRSYAATYLKEEIRAESLTRNIEGFSRFLSLAAACSGHFLDMSKLAREAKIQRIAAIRYFEILEDTLIVKSCQPFASSERKRLVQHPKFYFFDTGVLNAMLGNFIASDDRKGLLFEHLLFNQIRASAAHADHDVRVSTYRTTNGAEVDFIVEHKGKTWAIEAKASSDVGKNDLRGLKNFTEYHKGPVQTFVATLGSVKKKIDGVKVYPWQDVLREMGF